MRAVAVVVPGGGEFPRAFGLEGRVATPGLVEPLGPDQLVVAGVLVKALAGRAFDVVARQLVVGELAVLTAVAVRPVTIREAEALRPDAGVDHADDDVFAGAVDAAELIPQPARCVEAEKRRRVGGVDRTHLVLGDRQHTRGASERSRLLGSELG